MTYPQITVPHTQSPEVAGGEAKTIDDEKRVGGGKNLKASEDKQGYRDRDQRPRNKSRMEKASSRAGGVGDS